MVVEASITSQFVPGGWTTKRVPVGEIHFEMIVPADPDELLNQLEDGPAEDPLDPYWAALWPAAAPTADLTYRWNWPAGTSALELGCGCGLVGLAALAAGLEVTFSDVVPLAVELALENARRNGYARAHGRLIDWKNPPAVPRFPLILGSDLLYDTRDHSALLHTLDRLMTGSGQCWLGDPGRSAASIFRESAAAQGYSVRIIDDQSTPVAAPTLGQFQLLLLERHGAR